MRLPLVLPCLLVGSQDPIVAECQAMQLADITSGAAMYAAMPCGCKYPQPVPSQHPSPHCLVRGSSVLDNGSVLKLH